MAMRQRLGGISNTRPRQSYNPVYEDFQPHFELKEEQDAHIIHVHLPGFLKEQVKSTFVHSPGVIRVHGQRPLGNNKWSRFNQTFPIQGNSDTSKIHGKFNNGILTITVPKQAITRIGGLPKEAAKPIQDGFHPGLYGPPPTPSKASSTTTTVPQKSSSLTSPERKAESAVKDIDRKGKSEVNRKPEISEQAKPKSNTFGTAVNREKSKVKDFIAAEQLMKTLGKRMNKEDKQMLINMGAAVLVLLALGASVSYSFSLQRKIAMPIKLREIYERGAFSLLHARSI